MALDNNATQLSNLLNPQVLADVIQKKLVDEIKFAPLCRVDSTLVGRSGGNTVDLPSFTYIGNATDVNEGADIPIAQLTEGRVQATIKKIGRAVQITDEAILSGYGDPVGEAAKQIRLALASKIDNDVKTVLHGIGNTMTHTVSTTGTLTADDVADALVKFGEDIEGDKVIIVSPKMYNAFRKADDWVPASDIAASLLINGTVGMIHGCQVVVSNKITDYVAQSGETPAVRGEAYIVKPGALALFMKRDIMVETDRDIINCSNVIAANELYTAYLYDASKAIKVII